MDDKIYTLHIERHESFGTPQRNKIEKVVYKSLDEATEVAENHCKSSGETVFIRTTVRTVMVRQRPSKKTFEVELV